MDTLLFLRSSSSVALADSTFRISDAPCIAAYSPDNPHGFVAICHCATSKMDSRLERVRHYQRWQSAKPLLFQEAARVLGGYQTRVYAIFRKSKPPRAAPPSSKLRWLQLWLMQNIASMIPPRQNLQVWPTLALAVHLLISITACVSYAFARWTIHFTFLN